MLHIAICDDQANQISKIRTAVEYYTTNLNIKVTICEFDNPLLFLEETNRTGGADILLLDICMPGILGTEVAKEIRRRRDKTEIIFITTSDEFAVDAFAIKAAHYLLKPFSQTEFDEAMDRAMVQFNNGKEKRTTTKQMVLMCGKRLPLSRGSFRQLQNAFFEYQFREGVRR